MPTADQIKLHPASMLPSEKVKKKTQPKKEYMSTKLVPMLDAASNVCKSRPFASSYRHTAATPMRRVETDKKKKNITRI